MKVYQLGFFIFVFFDKLLESFSAPIGVDLRVAIGTANQVVNSGAFGANLGIIRSSEPTLREDLVVFLTESFLGGILGAFGLGGSGATVGRIRRLGSRRGVVFTSAVLRGSGRN